MLSAPFVLLFLVIGVIALVRPADLRKVMTVIHGIVVALVGCLIWENSRVFKVTVPYGASPCEANLLSGESDLGLLFSGGYTSDALITAMSYGIIPLLMLLMSLALLWRSLNARRHVRSLA